MKEIIIDNPTRIVDTHDENGYPRGLSVRVETPSGSYDAGWDHSPEAGCVLLEKDGESGVCRNPVLIASIVSFNNSCLGDWPEGVELPVLPEEFAKQYLKSVGIPEQDYDDPSSCFQNLLNSP